MAETFYTCGKCSMRFAIGDPVKETHHGGPAFTTCTEPGCGKRFWHSAPGGEYGSVARVGMTERDYDKVKANA